MKARTPTLAAIALIAAVALAACAPPAPSAGPPESSVSPAPPSAGTTGGTVPRGGSRTPDAATRQAVLAALRSDGFEVSDEPTATMTYSADRQTVAVTGAITRSVDASGRQRAEGVGSVEVRQANGTWVVVK